MFGSVLQKKLKNNLTRSCSYIILKVDKNKRSCDPDAVVRCGASDVPISRWFYLRLGAYEVELSENKPGKDFWKN